MTKPDGKAVADTVSASRSDDVPAPGSEGAVVVPRDSLATRVAFSSGGRPWMIVMKPTPRNRAIDRFILRWTGFSFITFEFALASGRKYHRPHMLLTTIGKHTGELRTSALPYFRFEDKLVVCGSAGGGPKDPQWAWNVRANPQVWIRVRRKLIPATAYVATGDERERAFPIVAAQHHGLQAYQDRASAQGRDVPLVMITPRRPVPR